ncbi:MAG: peptidylprolyl isomerase [Desulfuromonadales bacterium]|nr:peptidylprolyl isomerase [Desulfuromonadales bacterium]
MPNIIATVNSVPIDDKALAAAMQGLAQEQFHATLAEVPGKEHAGLRAMALERLIARELIYQAALAEGLVASAEEVTAERDRIVRLAGRPQDFWGRLAERGMDTAAFDRMVRKDVTVDLMTARKTADLDEPASAEIEAFFRENFDKLGRPERVKLSHILLPVDPAEPQRAEQEAQRIRALAAEEDFRELARKHSVCPSAPGGGRLGYVRRQDLDPGLADLVFTLPVGDVAGPVPTTLGLHLVKVEEHERPGPPTLDESRQKIIDLLQRIKAGALLERWVAELRQNADIVIYS